METFGSVFFCLLILLNKVSAGWDTIAAARPAIKPDPRLMPKETQEYPH
jgi:hypothetical protein